MKKTNIGLFIFACFLTSCNGQNTNIETCKEHLKKSKTAFNSFYTQNDQNLLLTALKESELAQDCPETKQASIELKISILSLQKNYNKAYTFVDSLDIKDFTKPYKKDMQSNLFRALDYELKSDLKNRNLYLKKAINEINNFIGDQKVIDKEAYYDLFFIKSKMLNKNQLEVDIVLLKKKYPNDKSFFELLKESFNDEEKQISISNTK